MAILLVRHAESVANRDGLLAGRTPGITLTETGRAQATALQAALHGFQPVAVVSSPIQRCQETAGLIAGDSWPKLQLDDCFAEIDYGTWSGRSLAEIKATEPTWTQVITHPDQVTFPGGESLQDAFDRACAGLARWQERITAEHGPHAHWVIVSHGDIIKSLLAHQLGLPLAKFQSIYSFPATVSAITASSHGGGVLSLNTTAGGIAELVARLPQAPAPPTPGGQVD